MELTSYSPIQQQIIHSPLNSKVFIEGPAGTGKTTTGVARLDYLLNNGIRADTILIFLPQRALAAPYYDYLSNQYRGEGGSVSILTIGGISRRMIELFWNLIVEDVGFQQPERPPTFLTLETAQYVMARMVAPLLDKGYFDSIKINRNRLYSQIIDNLNKSAAIGFPHQEIGGRLIAAEIGEPGQNRVYEDAQACSNMFREYCLEHNLLDFSLQVEIFKNYLWPNPMCRQYLQSTYRHLIFDNVEEDTPTTHDIIYEWLPEMESALLIYDQDAGYRRFLGADPSTALTLKSQCDEVQAFDETFVTSEVLNQLSSHLEEVLIRPSERNDNQPISPDDLHSVFNFQECLYFPDMLDWIAYEIQQLVESGTPAEEIVVLSPFLSDSVRFALLNRLESIGIATRSHRPSRSLREEPVTKSLLDLACLAHTDYQKTPLPFDMIQTLMIVIDGLDLVRSQLLCRAIYQPFSDGAILTPFDHIHASLQSRITYQVGEKYEYLRSWIEKYREAPTDTLDIFFSRLFGEVLSQPGFGFHHDYNSAEITANLIESIQKFRWITSDGNIHLDRPLGLEYIEMLNEGVIASQYLRSWQEQPAGGVLLAPAYTFLLRNQPVDYQFWLDVGSHAWYERLYQPLTHPLVLSRQWQTGRKWTSEDNFRTNRDTLNRLLIGLIRRCRQKVYLGFSDYGEQGDENRGLMLHAFQRVLQRISYPN